jgi:hypothetical protein
MQEQSAANQQAATDARWNTLRWIVATILLVAAGFKVANATQILAAEGLLSHRTLLYLTIGLEVMLSVFVVTAASRWAWLTTVATFSTFAAVSAYALFSGTDCNCFGTRIGPHVTLPLDVAIVLAAFFCRPSAVVAQSHDRKSRWAVSNLAIGLGLAFALVAGAHWQDRRNTGSANSQTLQFLLADEQVGKAWPIDEHLHPALSELREGRWLILVVRHDCDHCRELLAHFFSDPLRHRTEERTAVFVAGSPNWSFQFDSVSLETDAHHQINWPAEPFVASPAIFVLEDGTVRDAADGSASDDFLRSIFPST